MFSIFLTVNPIISLNRIKRLVFIIVTECVLCDAGSKLLCMIQKKVFIWLILSVTALDKRNEEWYDQEFREIIEAKREARLKCIQRNARSNQEEYNRKRISAARVGHRKKKEVLRRKVDETVEHHTKNESKKYYKKFKK